MPHYRMTSEVEGRGIQQRFRVGQVMYVMLDMRSFKNTVNKEAGR